MTGKGYSGKHEASVLALASFRANCVTEVLSAKERAVLRGIALPLLGHRVVGEDRLDRALRLARPAVNALVGVDVILVIALVDAVDWADGNTRGILGTDTRLRDNIGHGLLL